MTGDEWANFLKWWPIWSPILLVAIPGTVAGIWIIVSRRGGEKAARRNPLPPSWPEMWARIDAQDARIDGLERALATAQREKAEALVVASREKDEIISHVMVLEAGYPNPPGPPPRPWKFAT